MSEAKYAAKRKAGKNAGQGTLKPEVGHPRSNQSRQNQLMIFFQLDFIVVLLSDETHSDQCPCIIQKDKNISLCGTASISTDEEGHLLGNWDPWLSLLQSLYHSLNQRC